MNMEIREKVIGRNKMFSMLGFIGSLLFMTGDCLLYCEDGLSVTSYEPLWSVMPEWRFIVSAVLGFVGMSLMLPACVSFNRMIAETCGKFMRILVNFGFIGVASTGYLHFSIGSLLPITCHAIIGNGGTAELAEKVCLHWSEVIAPVNFALIGFLSIMYIVHFYVTVSGRSGLHRLTCLVGITGTFAVGMIWKLIFGSTAVGGAWCACESFGEGLTYLTTYFYWKKAENSKRDFVCR